MILSEVAVEPKVPEPAKAAKKPEPTVVPPKEEPATKGNISVCADPFFSYRGSVFFFFLVPLHI